MAQPKLQRHPVPLTEPLLRHLARWLLGVSARSAEGDLTGSVVVFPAKRPCESFKHVLLEESGRSAVLLPVITTPTWLADDLARRLGLGAHPVLPSKLRATWLAQPLLQLPLAAENPESAPGLAEELVNLFDEIRLHGCSQLLHQEEDDPRRRPRLAAGLASQPDRRLFGQDLRRLRQAWRAYRRVVPRDETDRLLEVLAEIESGRWPGPVPERAVVAGFAEMDPATARLLNSVFERTQGHLFESAAEDAVSKLFLTSFTDPAGPTGPLRPSQQVATRLGAGADSPPAADRASSARTERPRGTFQQRIQSLETELAGDPRTGQVELIACGDPEEESRTVAALVVEALGSAPDCSTRIAVVTADRDLASRVTAQLRDASIQVDDTSGIPLSRLPAGLFAHHLLKTVVTRFHHRPFLELMTHPFFSVNAPGGDPRQWALRFEGMIRGPQRPIGGLDGYLRRARDWDGNVVDADGPVSGKMTAFVGAIGDGLAPLRELGEGRFPWQDHLNALRESWSRLAPARPLDPHGKEQDEAALAALLESLAAGLELEPQLERTDFTCSLTDFFATLSRLLSNRMVWPHRSAFRPVQVTGPLEARLEVYDLLILAGATDEVLPGRVPRSVFLNDRARTGLSLPTWRDRLASDADLFLRLLNNGRRVVITWPTERQGQPCLPSRFVVRLRLSSRIACTRAVRPPLYRRQPVPLAALQASQAAFELEPAGIPRTGRTLTVRSLSHSRLKIFRDCPYRFLLQSGFGLKEEEEVVDAFRRQDYGNLVHECLQEFLERQGEGHRALRACRHHQAEALLREIATRRFGEGAAEMPQRYLWEAAFAQVIPDLVRFETERFAVGWRPFELEWKIRLNLGELQEWIAAADEAVVSDVALPDLPDPLRSFPITGKIDRIDRREGSDQLAVIDYKTGVVPSVTEVAQGTDYQVVLYSLALEAGRLPGNLDPKTCRVVQGAYYRVGRMGCGFDPDSPHLPGDTPAGREILARGAAAILEAAVAVNDPEQPYPLVPVHWQEPQPGPLPCRWCPFEAVCRLQEREKPAHLQVKLTRDLTEKTHG